MDAAPRRHPPRSAMSPATTTDDAWALVAPYRSQLIAVARARGLSLPDAQDVAHHVMCRAVERRPLDPLRVEASLVRAAVARCDDVREDAVRQEELFARTRGDDRLVGRLDDAVCDRAQVRWLLGKLPVRERRVVMLSVSGETVTGIAEATGLSYPTVDRLLSRARKEMRRLAGLLGVAGLALWRQRRLAIPAGATAAVAVASISVLVPPASVPPAVAASPPHSYAAHAVLGRSVAAGPARPATRPAVRRAAVPAPAEPDRAVPHPARPALMSGVSKPVDVEASGATPVDRVADCLKYGASVQVGSNTTVTCHGGDVLRP